MSTATPPAGSHADAPAPRAPSETSTGRRPAPPALAELTRHPYLALVMGSLLLAAVSLLVLPNGLGSDAWAWLVWGLEVLALDVDPTNGPSWKPLPVVFTAPLALTGDAAPVLWAIVARGGAFLALAFAYRLAARAAGRLAGVLAGLALAATELTDLMASGDSEPLAAALAVWALERHLDGRRGQAMALLAVAALGRPEAWVLLVGYAAFVVARDRRLAGPAAVALVVPPLLWLGPPWLATGDPLSASERANRLTEASLATADVPALAVVATAVELTGLPVLVAGALAAVAAIGPSLARRAGAHDRLAERGGRTAILALAGGAVIWIALVALLTQVGFTGNERYLFPAVAALCVLGGVGGGLLVAAVSRGDRRRGAFAVVVLLALCAPFGVARAREAVGFRAEAVERAQTIAGLQAAVERMGGPPETLACGSPAVTRPGTQGTLAWKLGVPLSGVARSWPPDPSLDLPPPAVVLSRAERRFNLLARAPELLAPGLEAAPVTARARGWQVFAVDRGLAATQASAERCRRLVRASAAARGER